MDKEKFLLQIAERQAGYFTSRQAEACGFSRPNFHRKLTAGKWLKESVRGVYRLANYPMTSRPELVLWTLWSADKKGVPQGVWSHETALTIHELSDVAPSKLHMTVPKNFRKGTSIPQNLQLHFVDEMSQSDIEVRQGYRVTNPIRTLADIIQDVSTQPERIEQAILDLAIKKSLIQGLLTMQEMERLQQYAPSEAIHLVIARAMDEVWSRAHEQLAELGRKVEPYTVGIILEGVGFGTGVLCEYNSRYFLLTAAHVARGLQKSRSVRLALCFDAHRRDYPPLSPKKFMVIPWDPNLEEKQLEDPLLHQPKDIAIVIPSEEIISTLKLYKVFYKIPMELHSISLKDALVSMGGIESLYKQDMATLNVGPYAFVASDYTQSAYVDYITCPVSNNTYEIRKLKRREISSFKGLSGSGLWKFKNQEPVLVGIAIAEGSYGNGVRNVYFHGPQSILAALELLGGNI